MPGPDSTTLLARNIVELFDARLCWTGHAHAGRATENGPKGLTTRIKLRSLQFTWANLRKPPAHSQLSNSKPDQFVVPGDLCSGTDAFPSIKLPSFPYKTNNVIFKKVRLA